MEYLYNSDRQVQFVQSIDKGILIYGVMISVDWRSRHGSCGIRKKPEIFGNVWMRFDVGEEGRQEASLYTCCSVVYFIGGGP